MNSPENRHFHGSWLGRYPHGCTGHGLQIGLDAADGIRTADLGAMSSVCQSLDGKPWDDIMIHVYDYIHVCIYIYIYIHIFIYYI